MICTFDGQPAGGSWGSDGNIIFAQVGGNPGLFRVSQTGGAAQLLIKPDASKNEREFRYPYILPGGESVLYTVIPAKSGHEAAHIAVHSLELTGSPFVIQDDVVTSGTGDAAYALSGDGTLVYLPGTSDPPRRLVWVSRDGKEVRPITNTSISYARYPRLSPDGRRLALTSDPASPATCGCTTSHRNVNRSSSRTTRIRRFQCGRRTDDPSCINRTRSARETCSWCRVMQAHRANNGFWTVTSGRRLWIGRPTETSCSITRPTQTHGAICGCFR